MSTRNNPITLLPPNALTAENAIATAAARLSDLAVPIDRLWNPATCPVSHLPWLAWALSVDSWDSTWPDAIKRHVLAESIAVHQRKGTLGAVRRAMAALGVEIDLVEWWEMTPPGEPHTFSLTASANANLAREGESVLNDRVYRALKRVIDATKPVRSHYDMKLAAGFAQSLIAKDAMSGANVARHGMAPPARSLEAHSGLGLAAGATALNPARRSAQPHTPPAAGMAGAVHIGLGAWSLSTARRSARPELTTTFQAPRLSLLVAASGFGLSRHSMELRA